MSWAEFVSTTDLPSSRSWAYFDVEAGQMIECGRRMSPTFQIVALNGIERPATEMDRRFLVAA
ncbi:hypothetical protein CO665_32850 [Rhizobium anhuiense]|jgi:hypothetical protein|nr:hypothetical protein CO665_32850 [Rhizobium anhuiense]